MMKFNLCFCCLLIMLTATKAQAQIQALLPCPTSPNCVSSQALTYDDTHYVMPFKLLVNCEEAWQALENALLQQNRTKITAKVDNALHAEVTSLIFRFVDDVDIMLDARTRTFHIRSASRIGYSDFGVNRRQVEALRVALQKARIIE